MEKLSFHNIFEAIVDDPKEAVDLKFRADMMLKLRQYFESNKLNQAQISELLDVPQPRVSELMRGRLDKFSSDKLIKYAAAAGFSTKPKFVKKDENKPVKSKVNKSPEEELELA